MRHTTDQDILMMFFKQENKRLAEKKPVHTEFIQTTEEFTRNEYGIVTVFPAGTYILLHSSSTYPDFMTEEEFQNTYQEIK